MRRVPHALTCHDSEHDARRPKITPACRVRHRLNAADGKCTVHMGAGRMLGAPLIHPMTSASSTHAVSRVLRPCIETNSMYPLGISLVSPWYLPGISLFRFLADAVSFRAGRGPGRGCGRGHGCGRAHDHARLPPRHGSHSCREHSRTCLRVRDHEASGLRSLQPLPDDHSR